MAWLMRAFWVLPSVLQFTSRRVEKNAGWSWWAESCHMPIWKKWKEMILIMCHRCTSESHCLMGSLLVACWSSWPYENIIFSTTHWPNSCRNNIWPFLSVSFVRLQNKDLLGKAGLWIIWHEFSVFKSRCFSKMLKYLSFQSRHYWEHFRGKYSPSDRVPEPNMEDRYSLICT